MKERRAIRTPGSPARAGLGLLLAFLLVALNPLASLASDPGNSLQANKPDFSARAQSDDEFEDLGLIDEFLYESPQFAYEVEWDDPWYVDIDESPENALVSDSETEPPYDMLRLESDENDEAVSVYGYLLEGSWLEDADDVPAAHVEEYYAYEDGEGLENGGIESIDVLLDDADDEYGSVLYLITWENGDQYISVNEVQWVDEYFISTAISADPLAFMDTYEAAREAIEIDGNPALTFLDEDDVADAVEEAIDEFDLAGGTTSDPDETPDTDSDTDTDVTYYLQGVRGAADALNESVDRFFELLSSDEELTDGDVDELNGILDLWASAPNLAIVGGEVLEGTDEIHELMQDYTDTLADAADAFVEYAQADEDEQDDLGDTFDGLIDDVYALYDDLTEALDDAE